MYRCYVKDQLDLTNSPKCHMVVKSFVVKEDLLTNATSTINVLDMASNVNNGDILVVYSASGQVIYKGVISAINELKITCNQMQSFYKGTWIYNVNPQTYLENELRLLTKNYADGKLYNSSYTDTLVAQRLGGITLASVGSLPSKLPTDIDTSGNLKLTQYDFEKFIYKMYQDYGIIYDFDIKDSGTNTCTIKVPSYSSIKLGNNNNYIYDMSPITTIEETNKLVIYAQNKSYRTTYIAKKDGTIVEAPSSTANRFELTNTKIVYSDDNVSDLVACNLPTQMYNHKLSFSMTFNNSLYDVDNFKLGMPLAIWIDSEYFNSILTGREITLRANSDIYDVKFTCGKVRTNLTNKLNLGVV